MNIIFREPGNMTPGHCFTGAELLVAAQVAGTVISFVGGMQQASAQEDAANYQAAIQRQQADLQAKQYEADSARLEYERGQTLAASKAEAAAGQREALVERHKSRLAQSRLQAVVGATGGGFDDPTIQALKTDIASEGAYRAAMGMYGGDLNARSLMLKGQMQQYDANALKQSANVARQTGQMQSNLTRLSGQIEAQGTRTKAYSNLLSSGSSLYDKYNAPGETITWNSQRVGGSSYNMYRR